MCFIYAAEDFDLPRFQRTKIVNARKGHRCVECNEEIPPGAQYETNTGYFDGEFFRSKTCLPCAEVRNAFFCNWLVGRVWEDFMNEDIDLASIENLSPAAIIKISDQLAKRGA